MTAALSLFVQFGDPFTCANCGVAMCLPLHLQEERQKNGGDLYCPNGHVLSYRKTELAKAREERDQARRERDAARARAEMAERSVVAYKGKVTEIKNRVGNGVCPCCKRTFKQLARHMACKHPEFKSEKS